MFQKPARPVTEVFLHCSASDYPEHDDWKVIDKWHREGKPPFDMIGYHFFITKAGERQIGRPLERIPAAQGDHNTGTIAICLHGLKEFTEAQYAELNVLCDEINQAYGGEIVFRGHKEVDPHRTCPVYDYVKVLKLSPNGFKKLEIPNKKTGFLASLGSLLFFWN